MLSISTLEICSGIRTLRRKVSGHVFILQLNWCSASRCVWLDPALENQLKTCLCRQDQQDDAMYPHLMCLDVSINTLLEKNCRVDVALKPELKHLNEI